MTAINPPPLKVPEKLVEPTGFMARLVETVRLLHFYYQQSANQTTLTGTTNGSQGGQTSVANGITSTGIKGISAVVCTASGVGVAAGNADTGLQFSVSFDATNVTVTNHPTNSANILSKSFTLFVFTAK